MDYRTLECFVALAEEAHFHRAAVRCNISQPGISHQLKKLEAELGVLLMTRNNRRVALTTAGKSFAVEAREILSSMDKATRIAREVDQGIVGTLTIGSTASGLFIFLPEILYEFRRRRPKVKVEVRQMTTAEQESALRSASIQVGICHPPLVDHDLKCTLLAALPFWVAMHEKHPLAEHEELFLADLAEETFIMFPRNVGPRLYDDMIAVCNEAGFSPREIVEVAPVQSIIAMAACGIGIGFVASKVQRLDRAHVVYRRLSGCCPQITLGAAQVQGGIRTLADEFIEVASQMGSIPN